MRRWNLPLVLGLILGLGFLVLLALPSLVNLRHPHDGLLIFGLDHIPMRPPLKPGVYDYLLGTDRLGRDLFSRLVHGARYTLPIAFGVAILRALFAVPIGLMVGWYGGRLNQVVSTLSAGFIAIPTLIFCSLFLRGLRNIVTQPTDWLIIYTAVMVFAGLPRMVEYVRQRTKEISLLPFVEAAVAVGAPGRRIVSRHLFPVMLGDVLIILATEMAWVLLMMGQLAVLGVFVGGTVDVIILERPVTVEYATEWAQMLGANRWLIRTHPWVPLFPAAALSLAAACFHLLAEGLRLRRIAR